MSVKDYSDGYQQCYKSHKALALGDKFKIYGGNSEHPVVEDADVYVGLQQGLMRTPLAYPWNGGSAFTFYITDGQAPTDAEEFKKLIAYLVEAIKSGRKVHVGCIGGHGRTGVVLAAVVRVMMGVEDAITYVRENYCKKAVESAVQVDFLHTHFGVKKVPGSRTYETKSSAPFDGGSYYKSGTGKYRTPNSSLINVLPLTTAKGTVWDG